MFGLVGINKLPSNPACATPLTKIVAEDRATLGERPERLPKPGVGEAEWHQLYLSGLTFL